MQVAYELDTVGGSPMTCAGDLNNDSTEDMKDTATIVRNSSKEY